MKPYSWALLAVLCLSLSCQNNKTASADTATSDQKVLSNSVKEEPKQEALQKPAEGLLAADTSVQTSAAPAPLRKTTSAVTQEDWDKKIIRTADLQMELRDYHAFDRAYREGIRKLGGYIAKEEQRQSDERIENNVSIRVPVASFEEAISLLTPSGEKLIDKKISSEDVGSQIMDTRARMEARKHIRDRYLEMLKQAKTMEEILQVQNEINEQQETIESAAGRVNYLSHAAAYSTINLTYYQLLVATPVVKEPGYALRFWEALKNGWNAIASIGLVLANIWPLLLLVIAGIWFLYRKGKKALPQTAAK